MNTRLHKTNSPNDGNGYAEIPMSSPDLSEAEREAVAAVLRTPRLSMGSETEAFEAAFKAYTGCRRAIAVSSGTAGLHLCVRAAGITDGDLVLTTPFSFVASANVLLFERAIPVFVDVEIRTGNLDVEQLAEAARDLADGGAAARRWLPRQGVPSRSTSSSHSRRDGALRAILSVDVFGQPADMDRIQAVAREHGLALIEDACEALGAEYKGRLAGTLGDYGVYAFYPNKQITTGEGAVIVTDDEQAGMLMDALRNQGRAPGDTWLQHTYLGYNYRLDEMSAALGRVQMGRIEELLRKRERVATWYNERLAKMPGVELPMVHPDTTRVSWFVYVIRLSPGIDRQQVASDLKEYGIPARPYFLPIHLQPYMVERFGYRTGDYPRTEDLGRRGLALPFSGVMSEAQVDHVCRSLRQALSNKI